MNNLSDDLEREAIDHITDCMYAIDYLCDVSNYTFSDEGKNVTLDQFYKKWFLKTGSTRKAIVPFNPGVFLGYLYVGILYAKENWFDLLPEDTLDKSDQAWGLNYAGVSAPKKRNPTVKYVVRRIRNSLGHGRPVITVPAGIKPEELFTNITFSFHDVDTRDAADTFDVVLSLAQLIKLIKKFQSVIHKSVREKKVVAIT
jgi:HEPN pEK499 p136